MEDLLSYELVQRFMYEAGFDVPDPANEAAFPKAKYMKLANRLAQYGADQELEACCNALDKLNDGYWSVELRAARRPKPTSLKDQGIKSLDAVVDCLKALVPGASVDGEHIDNIRRALESIPDPQ